jgi:membrane associated rhomboid family serine protease
VSTTERRPSRLSGLRTPRANLDEAERFGTQAFFAALGRAFLVMCAVVPVLELIVFLDQHTQGKVDDFAGIRPHDPAGLRGVLLAPLVHSGLDHLLANSAPLIILGTFVLASGARRFLLATLIIAVVSGLGVWFLTPPQYLVVGASGVIFGWLGFLVMRGIVESSLWNFAVVLVAGLLYGWQVYLLLPTQEAVSWQGHLFGFIGGGLAAILLRRRRPLAQTSPTTEDDPVWASPQE